MKRLLLFFLIPGMLLGQTQIGEDIDGEVIGDRSGTTVDISSDGSIIAIGAVRNEGNGEDSGHVRIYENVNGTWIQIGQDIDGENAGDGSGFKVSISSDGGIVAIGAPFNDGNDNSSGHVRIYENVNSSWVQIGQDIDGENSGDQSGRSVRLSSDGNVVAIGATGNDGNDNSSGHVRIYENVNSTWVQIGQDIDGENAGDGSGRSISLSSDGTIVAIGATGNDDNEENSGHVRVYGNINSAWTQIGQDINGESNGDFSGESVSLSSDGTIVAVGAPLNDDNGNASGHVRVFQNIDNVWTQIGEDIDGEVEDDLSGNSISLSLDGSILAIGATSNDGNGNESGHVRIYKNIDNVWIQIGEDIDGEEVADQSANSVSLSADGTTVVIGAPLNDGNGSESGHVRVYDLTAILSTPENTTTTFTLYPNPTKNQFNIQLSDGETLEKADIYNNLGQLIKSTTQSTADISDLSSGVYFVKVQTTQGKGVNKLIIE